MIELEYTCCYLIICFIVFTNNVLAEEKLSAWIVRSHIVRFCQYLSTTVWQSKNIFQFYFCELILKSGLVHLRHWTLLDFRAHGVKNETWTTVFMLDLLPFEALPEPLANFLI